MGVLGSPAREAIRAAGQVLVDSGKIGPGYIESMLGREGQANTYLGNGIAIPHARFAALAKPFGILARLRQPIDFDAIDGQRVDLVFVLLLPASPDGEQLGALACVARQLRLPSVIDQLRRLKKPAELYAEIVSSTEP